jgi:hypothetical protein
MISSERRGRRSFSSNSAPPAGPLRLQGAEQVLSRWLTLVANDVGRAASASDDNDDRAAKAYYGAIADAFLATIDRRIRFWASAQDSLDAGDYSKHEIERYVERMRGIEALSAEGGLDSLNGWGRLLVIAGTLLLGSEVADRVRHRFDEMAVDERLELLWAADELIFMVERENGHAVEFKPTEAA